MDTYPFLGGDIMIANFFAPHLVSWYCDIYINVYGIDKSYEDIMLKFNNYLKVLVNTVEFEVFSNTILILGLVLLLFHFFGDLTEKATMKQLSLLQLGKSFCACFGTIFVLFHTKEIFIFMLELVESLNSMINVQPFGVSSLHDFYYNETVQLMFSRCVSEHFSLWSILGYTLTAFVLMLVDLGTKLYVLYYAATRTVQLFIFYILAPIGVVDIFENGPGGTINFNSGGFRYLKKIFAIMLQLVAIAVVTQAFPLLTTTINAGYFEDQGDTSLKTEGDMAMARAKSISYPARNLEYTDHHAPIRDLVIEGKNTILESLKSLSDAIGNGDDDDDSEQQGQAPEPIDESEKYKVTDVVNLDGSIVDEEKNKEIIKNPEYRMTIESTEMFFNWCTGADGAKMGLFIILMITKVLLIYSASKLCNYIVGISV